jgi:hypothetical protein
MPSQLLTNETPFVQPSEAAFDLEVEGLNVLAE